MLPPRHLVAAALMAWPLLATAAPAESLAGTALAGVPAPAVPGIPGELRGRVTFGDGTPVPSFTVNGNHFGDSTGAFKILVPPEGEFRVVVRAQGFAPNVVHVQGAAGKKLVMPEIALGQGEDLFGEVLDAKTGQPVPDARVALADPPKVERLRLVRPEPLTAAATTGSGGYFWIKGAPRAMLMLVVYHPRYLTEFVPVNTRERTVSVNLHRGGAIAGRVVGPGGKPLPGVKVAAVSEGALDGDEVWTDARGGYEFNALRPGAYTVWASPAGGKAAMSPAPVQVADGRVVNVPLEVKGKARHMDLEELQLGASGPPLGPVAAR